MNHQIVQKDLLFWMLVVDTRGRVQNMKIMKLTMFLKVLLMCNNQVTTDDCRETDMKHYV